MLKAFFFLNLCSVVNRTHTLSSKSYVYVTLLLISRYLCLDGAPVQFMDAEKYLFFSPPSIYFLLKEFLHLTHRCSANGERRRASVPCNVLCYLFALM